MYLFFAFASFLIFKEIATCAYIHFSPEYSWTLPECSASSLLKKTAITFGIALAISLAIGFVISPITKWLRSTFLSGIGYHDMKYHEATPIAAK